MPGSISEPIAKHRLGHLIGPERSAERTLQEHEEEARHRPPDHQEAALEGVQT